MKISPWKWIGVCKCDVKPDDNPYNYPHGHFEDENGQRQYTKVRSLVQGRHLLEHDAVFKGTDTSMLQAAMELDVSRMKLPVCWSVSDGADLVDLFAQCMGSRVGVTFCSNGAAISST